MTIQDPKDRFGRVALICRFKPVHLGQKAMLDAALECSDHLVVGIGSPNKYDVRNPFTAAETRDMLECVLSGRSGYEVIEVKDLDDGPRWRVFVRDMLGPLDLFLTANEYVRSLLEEFYEVRHPVSLVPPSRRVRVNGTLVRQAMARSEPWRHLVPDEVARYLDEHGLVDRFRREFGLQTLALETGG